METLRNSEDSDNQTEYSMKLRKMKVDLLQFEKKA